MLAVEEAEGGGFGEVLGPDRARNGIITGRKSRRDGFQIGLEGG